MEGAYKDKYSFIGEWYDNQASLIRRFNVFYYPTDDTLEMFDLKNRKTFVRRVKVNGITLDSFYIGCTLYILGRLIKIVDFACEDTRKKLHKDMQVTFAMIKPIPTKTAGKILTHFHEHGLRVTRMKKARLTADDVNILYRTMLTDPTFPFLMEYLTGQLVYGLELVGKDAVSVCIKTLGDSDPLKAEPETIRALYGTDPVRNCVHAAANPDDAMQDIEYFFPPPPLRSTRLRLTATLSNCTLCIVKPHAIREGKLGAALEGIDEGGFEVTALNMFIVENINAAEFYEVYKGIVPEYKGMVEELSSGPCVAMEIVSKDRTLNTAVEFRKLVGPSDPEIARLLRPHTLRAKLGKTKVQNAVHCSDLAEDGLLEVEYFFKILDL
ncbi:nucleoside diphosphate kinase 7 [Ostrinia nubilalis]|uniref:nucleoside diphosphate kinase 7 n=1 Tax=Ostrinia nubilalis TaxID=29057 RepID=UPI00103CC36A|nr:nucleoside diphosphate kinase 7 isoform X1 [Ostrinia furnacalis]XP_028178212.1 nucleoside diphosphate kinase 7 isoform X2 [Ostrinia furnacalis]